MGNFIILDAQSDAQGKAVDAIGLLFAGLIDVCGHLIDVLVELVPGKSGNLITVSMIWMLTIATVAAGFKIIIDKQLGRS